MKMNEKQSFWSNRKGKVTQKYKIVREVGRGISGTVYLGYEKASPKVMRAIKRIEKKIGSKAQEILNQLQILQEMDHPDIVRLHEWFEDECHFYLVTDFCEGGELFDYLQKKCYLSEDEARSIFSQMLGAVKYCHNKNIAHRDLKPQNFMLLKKPSLGQPVNLKLIDFGLAIRWKSNLEHQLLATGKRKIVGTAYYISPEVIKGAYNQKCDIWSVGVILYILVTGVPPFDGETDKQILKCIQKSQVSFSIPEMNSVSLLLKDLLKKMLKPALERISIEDIYRHPWMTVKVNKAPISIDFRTIASFSKFSKIKSIAANYLASQMTALESENLEKMFKVLDENNDGYLSIDQINKYLVKNESNLSKITMTQLKNLLQLIDTDTGKINYTQFLATTISEKALSAKENLQKVFKMMDSDGNGYVDRNQILQILNKHGYMDKQKVNQQINEIFETTDSNNDGKIDFNEFAVVMCKVAQ